MVLLPVTKVHQRNFLVAKDLNKDCWNSGKLPDDCSDDTITVHVCCGTQTQIEFIDIFFLGPHKTNFIFDE